MIAPLKSKIYKYMISVAQNVYTDKFIDVSNKYKNTYHNTIKMKPLDVKSNTYIDFGVENNDKDSKFKVEDHVTFLKKLTLQIFL